MPKTRIFRIFYLSARVAYPWSIYGIKLARIEEIKKSHIWASLTQKEC